MDKDNSKKRFALILALVGAGIFVLGILAFSGKLGGNKQSTSKPEGSIFVWGTIPDSQFRAAYQTIANKQNKIGVNYVYVEPSVLKTKLAEAIALDVGPDIVISSTPDFYSIKAYTQPIPFSSYPESSFRQSFASISGELVQPEGILAIPLTIDPIVMFYNRDILASSGYSVTPKLWSDVLAMAKDVIKIEQGQILRQELIPLGQYKNVNNAWAVISTLFLQSRIPIVTISSTLGKNVNLNAAYQGASSGPDIVEFFTQFSDPASEFYTWNRSFADAKREFLQGRLAFYPSFASEAKDINERNPNLNFGVAQIPQLNDDARFQTTFANLYVASLSSKTKNSLAAYAMLFEFASNDFQKAISQNTLMAPSATALLMAPPETTYLPIVYKSAIISSSWYNTDMAQTDKAFGELIENVITGKLNPQNAILQAERVLSGNDL